MDGAACLVPADEDQEGHAYFPDNVISQVDNLFAKTELKVLFIFYLVTIVCVTCMCGHMCRTRHMNVRGQLCSGGCCLPSSHGFGDSNSGCQACPASATLIYHASP